MSKKKTHEEYVAEVARINPDIEVVGIYITHKTKILHRCKIDGYEWIVAPSHVLRGQHCPRCSGHERYGHSEYVRRVSEINPNIEVIGIYIDTQTKILHRCKIDGYEWMAAPGHILRHSSCPKCSGCIKRTQEMYIEEILRINPDIEVLGRYVSNKKKVLHRCKVCGYEWETTPRNILNGFGCPRCSKRERYGHDEYVKRVEKINPNIEVVGVYVGSRTPILFRCKIDNYEWYAMPSHILQGSGCPKCSTSKGEKRIANWLDEENILYECQKKFDDCKNVLSLPFDFYLPEYNILIEYNGIQHYEPVEYFGGEGTFERQKIRDDIKKEYCIKNNIFLFIIPYFENINDELIRLYDFIKMRNAQKEVSKVERF